MSRLIDADKLDWDGLLRTLDPAAQWGAICARDLLIGRAETVEIPGAKLMPYPEIGSGYIAGRPYYMEIKGGVSFWALYVGGGNFIYCAGEFMTEKETYNVYYRCWDREPKKEETEAAEWLLP